MKFPFISNTHSKALQQQIESLESQLKEAAHIMSQIQKGNPDSAISDSLLETEFGTNLLAVKNHLIKISQEEDARNWLNIGLAKFSDILRNKDSLDLQKLSDYILAQLVKYLGANQGAIFVLEDNQYLDMLACYAYDRKKYLERRINVGEGLVGQCVLEKEPIYITQTPQNYISITSGLGDASPRCILISPLKINDHVFGVLEVASFKQFEKHQFDFIDKLSENIAASIKNVKDSEATLSLLNSSQQQTEELRAQEEEMRQNLEELMATQEEMNRKAVQLNQNIAESQGLLRGINATMATVEFNTSGVVITANDNFLKSMKYELNQIVGNHHRQFVSQEESLSDDYHLFWQSLAMGESFTGVFKRLAADGELVWLNAIYNPIFDGNGKVVKIIKFATDITKEQKIIAESSSVLNSVNSMMAMLELSPEGIIVAANDIFLTSVKYNLSDVEGQFYGKFIEKDTLQNNDFQLLWQRLSAGESVRSEFKFIVSNGELVSFEGIYTPVVGADGKVFKIIKLALVKE